MLEIVRDLVPGDLTRPNSPFVPPNDDVGGGRIARGQCVWTFTPNCLVTSGAFIP